MTTTKTKPALRTCRGCRQPFEAKDTRHVFCDLECRRTYNQRAHTRKSIDHDYDGDLSEAEIEQRFRRHLTYLRATRKYQVDPFQQGRLHTPMPQYD